MRLIAATDAIIPIETHYLETGGLLSVITKINEIREGWRILDLRVSSILATKMDKRVKVYHHLLKDIKSHPMFGKLLMGIIPMNKAVSYAHRSHRSIFAYNPDSNRKSCTTVSCLAEHIHFKCHENDITMLRPILG